VAALLERLVRLVPPPKRPAFSGTLKAFRTVEQALGLKLPETYKRVVRSYGQGLWQGFWCIASPFAEGCPGQPRPWHIPRYAVTAGPEACARLRTAKEKYPQFLPWPVYPEPGGLFPWALTDNGGTLYWLTAGDPETWPTLHDPHDLRPETWERYDVPFADLLYKTVTGKSGLFREELGEHFEYGRSDAFRPWPGSPSRGPSQRAEPSVAPDRPRD
jgi:hypothetical protein